MEFLSYFPTLARMCLQSKFTRWQNCFADVYHSFASEKSEVHRIHRNGVGN